MLIDESREARFFLPDQGSKVMLAAFSGGWHRL
jgi:hypothetical protein